MTRYFLLETLPIYVKLNEVTLLWRFDSPSQTGSRTRMRADSVPVLHVTYNRVVWEA